MGNKNVQLSNTRNYIHGISQLVCLYKTGFNTKNWKSSKAALRVTKHIANSAASNNADRTN
jgi:hypothetical protein